MRDESQNALLKTLEEPPDFVHLILLSSEPEALLETVASRCQPVDFAPLPAAVLEAELAADGPIPEIWAGNRPIGRRRSPRRRGLPPGTWSGRGCCSADRAASCAPRPSAASRRRSRARSAAAPWKRLLDRAEAAGEEAEAAAREVLEEESKSGLKRTARDIADGVQTGRAAPPHRDPRPRLELCAAWLRDLAVVAAGAEEVAFNRDRLDVLRAQAAGVAPGCARQGAELVQETRRGLDLNVSEELALEALFFRLERLPRLSSPTR